MARIKSNGKYHATIQTLSLFGITLHFVIHIYVPFGLSFVPATMKFNGIVLAYTYIHTCQINAQFIHLPL